MKNLSLKNGQLGLLLSLSVLVTACNPEEYYPIEELLTGEDAFCYQAKDLNSCQDLAPRCQPAYMPSESEEDPAPEDQVFAFCIANPGYVPPSDGSTDGSNDGSTGGSDDGSTGGSDDGSTGGSDDGSTGGSDDGSTGGSDDGSVDELPPTLRDVVNSKCENLAPEYLWVKKELKKKKVIRTISKVKLCHQTANGDEHTIVIACPAVRAHVKHHDDYIGACIQ